MPRDDVDRQIILQGAGTTAAASLFARTAAETAVEDRQSVENVREFTRPR